MRFSYAPATSSHQNTALAPASARVTVRPCIEVRFASVSIAHSIVLSVVASRASIFERVVVPAASVSTVAHAI